MHRNKISPNFRGKGSEEAGRTAHKKIATVIIIKGLIKNNVRFAAISQTLSFVNSLITSLNGCRIPLIPVLFGPFRS